MAKLIWIALLVFCLVAVQAKKKSKAQTKAEDIEAEGDSNTNENENLKVAGEPKDDDDSEVEADSPPAEGEEGETKVTGNQKEDEKAEEPSEEPSEEKPEKASSELTEQNSEDDDNEKKEFSCNLKFKKVGCFADKSKKQKPLKSFIMSDADMGSISKKGKLPKEDTFNSELPKFACKCANEAIDAGNAIFGIQNIAECWTGPDDSKYDKDGASDNCVAFDYKPCNDDSEVCAGKKHANYVYYIDTPEHTKSADEIRKEQAATSKKKKQQKKKDKKKAKKLLKKKSKKSKKSKQ